MMNRPSEEFTMSAEWYRLQAPRRCSNAEQASRVGSRRLRPSTVSSQIAPPPISRRRRTSNAATSVQASFRRGQQTRVARPVAVTSTPPALEHPGGQGHSARCQHQRLTPAATYAQGPGCRERRYRQCGQAELQPVSHRNSTARGGATRPHGLRVARGPMAATEGVDRPIVVRRSHARDSAAVAGLQDEPDQHADCGESGVRR